MRQPARNTLLALFVAVLAIVAWLALPGPFAHGVIVGAFGGIGLVLGAALGFARAVRRRVGTNLRPPPLPVNTWDYALDGQDLTGDPVAFSHYAGRVLVLNFWATWCGPCLAEMPSLQRLLAATADLDVALVCLTREDPEVARGFVEKQGLQLPVFVYRGEPPDCFRHRGIPATFVLDRRGSIVMQHLGAAAWDDPGVVAFVRGLAASPT